MDGNIFKKHKNKQYETVIIYDDVKDKKPKKVVDKWKK